MADPTNLDPSIKAIRDDIRSDVDSAIAENPVIAKMAKAIDRIESSQADSSLFEHPGYSLYREDRREHLQDSKGMPEGEAKLYARVESDGRGTIELYDAIDEEPWGVSAKSFVAQMEAFRKEGVTDLDIRLNSPGGDVFDGLAIYNRLVQWPGDVDVYIDSVAASAASLVAMAGNRIFIAETAEIMIHSPWTFVGGNARRMREVADVLDRVERNLLKAYQRRTGIDEERLIELLHNEEGEDGTTMPAEMALELGFADEIIAQETKDRRLRGYGSFQSASEIPQCFGESRRAPDEARHHPGRSQVSES